jgi:hypothetical protein
MSSLVAPPPRPASRREEDPKRPANKVWLWFWANADTRSVKVGVLATVLVHLLLALLLPRLMKPEPFVPYKRPLGHGPIRIHLNMPARPRRQLVPPQTIPQNYVEANPNAPKNKPDHTNNFSDRDQQAAQEHPNKKSKPDADRPTIKGQKNIQSNMIVDGRLIPPTPPTPPKPEAAKTMVKKTATPKVEQNPLSGKVKDTGDNPHGFGSDIAAVGHNKPIPHRIDGAKDSSVIDSQPYTTPNIDPKHPQPRRTLTTFSRPAIFADNPVGTSNLGITGIDARWSNYGAYLRRMLEIVQVEFDKLVEESQIYPPSGSQAWITFKLNSQGKISAIVTVAPKTGCTDAAAQTCVSSITLPAPYDPWTDDMIAMLGTEQQMTFIFYYE